MTVFAVGFLVLMAASAFAVSANAKPKVTAWKIHALSFEGNRAIPTDFFLKRITLKPGSVLMRDQLKFSLGIVESNYRDKGYYEVRVSTEISVVQPQEVDVRFIIAEGDLFHIGAIHIQGNRIVTNKIILRNLKIKSGDLFSQNKIFEGNRQLYMTGYFDSIDFAYSTSTAHTVDVSIKVKERATRFAKGGVGYGTETKERVSAGYEDMNFFGNARKLDVSATYSGFLTSPSKYRTTLVQTSLTQPNLFDSPYEGQTNVSEEWDDRESYDSVATAWRSSVGRRYSSEITASMRYRYTGTRVTEVSLDAGTTGFTNISAVGPTFTYDNTNDPFLPSKGWRIIGTYEEGVRFFAGDVRFHKLESRVGRFDTSFGGWTFFEGIQAGEIRPDSSSAQDVIPIFERYFIGGANTVRGYGERELGPRDPVTGVPDGGNAFLVGNLELRHQLYKKLYGVTFLDGGQLYDTPAGNVWPYMKMTQLNDFRYGTGFGFRLHSPVGAIRLEFGYQLNPEEGTGFFERTAVHFSIGEVF